MKLSILFRTLSIILPLTSLAAKADDVPHNFSANTPARAAEVNANFQHVNNQTEVNLAAIQAAETRLAALESAINVTPVELENGEATFEVDCSNDGAALLTKYQENLHINNLNFAITGDCYGNIDDLPGADTGAVQLADQTINIYAQDATARAGLIPNPETNAVFMYAGLNGGLYIHNIDITAGDNDWNPILLSRNGHGDLNNVSISGSNWTNVLVQEGAQLYASDLTLSGAGVGIFARNNASVRIFGTLTSEGGVQAMNSSSVNQQGNVTISVGGVYLDSASSWHSHYNPNPNTNEFTVDVAGNISVFDQSVLKPFNLVVGGNINANGGTVKPVNTLTVSGFTGINNGGMVWVGGDLTTAGKLYSQNGSLRVGGAINSTYEDVDDGSIHLTAGSALVANSVSALSWVEFSSSTGEIEGHGEFGGTFAVVKGSKVTIDSVTSTGEATVDSGNLTVNNASTFNGGFNLTNNGYIQTNDLTVVGHANMENSVSRVNQYSVLDTLLIAQGEAIFMTLTANEIHLDRQAGLKVYFGALNDTNSVVDILHVKHNSDFYGGSMTVNTIEIKDSSSSYVNETSFGAVHVEHQSNLTIHQNSTITGDANLYNSSLTVSEGATTSAVTLVNSDATLHDSVDLANFSCQGQSSVEKDGWVKVDEFNNVDSTTNCSDRVQWQNMLDNYLNNLVVIPN